MKLGKSQKILTGSKGLWHNQSGAKWGGMNGKQMFLLLVPRDLWDHLWAPHIERGSERLHGQGHHRPRRTFPSSQLFSTIIYWEL